MSGIVYVVPPYLVNTALGQELSQDVAAHDPALAARNFFPCNTPTYRFRSPRDLSSTANVFCEDPDINDAIKRKLREKFAVLGVLGTTPASHLPDDYLFELYDIFKHRLSLGSTAPEPDTHAESLPITVPPIGSTSPTSAHTVVETKKRSVFEVPYYGEFLYGPDTRDPSALDHCPLELLMKWAHERREHKYSFSPHLVINGKNSYLSPLPMYWTPLSVGPHLKRLDDVFQMQTDIEDGHAVLKLELKRDAPLADPSPRKKRFYNFIANNEIQERAGIFYYELQVEQTASASTGYKSIIHANDASLSSGSALFFNMGFTKRNIKFDKMPSSAVSMQGGSSTIDLKAIQSELCRSTSDEPSTLDEDTVTFLGAEPGVSFEGSLAVSFNNSCSYASIKTTENNYRASSLNLNRRFSQLNRHAPGEQEMSKLDIDVPFSTHSQAEHDLSKKLYHTDTVGFGVNFIDRSLFITLNGILVKTFTDKEISSSNKNNDSIFSPNSESGSLFPMIGFQLTDFSKPLGDGELPRLKITTNFGLRSFQFNINSYAKKVKLAQNSILQTTIAEEIQSIAADSSSADMKFERAVCSMKDDSTILNDFIKGYLIQEGFLDTYNSFESDLSEMAKNTSEPDGMDVDSSIFEKHILATQASDRQQLRDVILKHNFLEAIGIIESKFAALKNLDSFVFELELSHYVELLGKFASNKLKTQIGGFSGKDGAKKLTQVTREAHLWGEKLLGKTASSASTYFALSQLTSILLISSATDLDELPQGKKLVENHFNDVIVLANMVNKDILALHKIERESKLETMVSRVGTNISLLSNKNENLFKLINYQRDYLDTP